MKSQSYVTKMKLEAMLGKPISGISELPFSCADSITGAVSLKDQSIRKYELAFEDGTHLTVVCKYKSSRIIINGIKLLNHKGSLQIFLQLLFHHSIYGFENSHIREARFYKHLPHKLRGNIIKTYGLYHDKSTDRHIVVMANQGGNAPTNIADCFRIVDAITDFHGYYYNDIEKTKPFCLNEIDARSYKRSKKLISLLWESMAEENRAIYTPDELAALNAFASKLEYEYSSLPEHRTLCHNDLSARNIFCDGERVYIYDWELAAYRNPEHDIIDLLSSLADRLSDGQIFELLEYFRAELAKKTAVTLSDGDFQKLIRFNLMEFIITRATILRIANIKLKKAFILTLAKNTKRLMELLLKGKI